MRFSTVIVLFSVFAGSALYSPVSNLGRIKASGIIKICIQADYEPFVIKAPKENFPGFDIELATAYSDYLGVKASFIPKVEIADHLKSVAGAECDIGIGGISSSLERSKTVSFSNPYLVTTPAALVNKSFLYPEYGGDQIVSREFSSLDQLVDTAGLYFSVKSGTTNAEWLDRIFFRSVISRFRTNKEALQSLIENKSNVLVADSLYIEALLQKSPELKVGYVALLERVAEEHISIIVPREDYILQNNLNFFIKEMVRSGKVNEMKLKYFNSNDWINENN